VKVCFLAKKNKPGLDHVVSFLKQRVRTVDYFFGEPGEEFPSAVYGETYDLLVSYISPWIVPESVLEKTRKWNLNFHPGPPEYPGTGCFNFAIYNSATEFGVTAHVMNKSVDTGKIVGVIRFPMSASETVTTLSEKTYLALTDLFIEVMDVVVEEQSLPVSSETWKRKPYKRVELEALAAISPLMKEEEVKKRIRATFFPGKPGPFIDLFGQRFEFNPER